MPQRAALAHFLTETERYYQGHVRLKIFVDNVIVFEDYYSCLRCHSRDVWGFRVNQYTGEVIRLY